MYIDTCALQVDYIDYIEYCPRAAGDEVVR